MLKFLKRSLSDDEIDEIEEAVSALVEQSAGEKAIADAMRSLRRAAVHQYEAAERLVKLLGGRVLTPELTLDFIKDVRRAHPDNYGLLALIGGAAESLVELDFLNAAPPSDAFLLGVVDDLERSAASSDEVDSEETRLSGLATAARMLGRQRDDVAKASYERLVKLNSRSASNHYNLGLYYKTRGLFEDGVRANLSARSLDNTPRENVEWNLGICATGAGQGELALDVWKRMGQKIEMGRFDLPEGGYPECKVRLAERPLAERDVHHDDPGLEETIWIERLSPCHGIVRSVLYGQLGVDYGDVVLIDGAPITYHSYGDTEVPVFPQLATLLRRSYQLFDFAGTQEQAHELEGISDELDADCVVYSHTERFQLLCSTCWNDPDVDHERHDKEEAQVVTGRIAAPPDIDASALLRQLDVALTARARCRLLSPQLCRAAGEDERARFEQRQYDGLTA